MSEEPESGIAWVFLWLLLGILGAIGVALFDVYRWLRKGIWESTVIADFDSGILIGCIDPPADWVGLWKAWCWATGDLHLSLVIILVASFLAIAAATD